MKTAGLDFKKRRIVKGHALSAAERVRAARGVPQAIMKIARFAHGPKAAKGILSYISRKGALDLETETGDTLRTVEDQRSLVNEWYRLFDRHPRSRDVVHLIFSTPKGVPEAALRQTIRTLLPRHFPGHSFVYAIHTDKPNKHAHVALMMKNNHTFKKLPFRMEDIWDLRIAYAKAAREHGINLAVSPRAARGVGRKADKQAVYQMKKRGQIPLSVQATHDRILKQPGWIPPWEKVMRERNRKERLAHRAAARQFRDVARRNPALRSDSLKIAEDLEQFAKDMPKPKTLRQELLERMKSRPKPAPATQLDTPPRPESER